MVVRIPERRVVVGYRINTEGTINSDCEFELTDPEKIKLIRLSDSTPEDYDEIDRAVITSYKSLRLKWERLWKNKRPIDFDWYEAHEAVGELVPHQLKALLESGTQLPAGAALDVGCGSGVVTKYLALHFCPTIGIDIAANALRQAKVSDLSRSALCTADARMLPFRTSSFALVFDRGCLHNIAPRARSTYLSEVQRTLVDGGFLVVFERAGLYQQGPLLSFQGLFSLIRNFLLRLKLSFAEIWTGEHPDDYITLSSIRPLLPAMEVVKTEVYKLPWRDGATVPAFHGVFRKREPLPRPNQEAPI